MIKTFLITSLALISTASANLSIEQKPEVSKRDVIMSLIGPTAYIFAEHSAKNYIKNRREFFELHIQVLEYKKSIQAKKERERLINEKSRFIAYTRALETCLVTNPVANETTQTSSAGIQSDWCLKMRKSFAADMVIDLARSKGISRSQLESDQELVGELIQELRDSGKLTSVEVGNSISLREISKSSGNLDGILSQPEANR
ncbi:MAG: hypothetical protein ACK5V3_00550 [Bdellovibrionales bacterium]